MGVLWASLRSRYQRIYARGSEEHWYWVLRLVSRDWIEESVNGFGSLFEKFYDWLKSEIERGRLARSYLDFAARDRVERVGWWDRL